MKTALLIDIGSTYTKVSLVDLERARLIDKSQAFTTVKKGIDVGLMDALSDIKDWQRAEYKLACSSAAGGLKLIAIGLVPELTAEAARRAALGAGSKVLKTYSYQLNEEDLADIAAKKPDIILLAGGTDGGNKDNIIFNARKLAETAIKTPIIVAGNRNASREVGDILKAANKEVHVTDNVMPELEELNIEPARKMIREIFLEKIIDAKGLTAINGIIDGIVMPTPSAVLKAARFLAEGYGNQKGIGELIVVDIGGATTDVHSIASGEPSKGNVNWRGLEEPYVKRTVEGDLGMRYSLSTLLDAVDERLLERQLRDIQADNVTLNDCKKLVNDLRQNPDKKTQSVQSEIENILAYNAVRIAVERHVGSLETIYTPLGPTFVQKGKDLTKVKHIIGTGGIIVNNRNPQFILSGGLNENQLDQGKLAPIEPSFLIDKEYILAAAGLLAEIDPEISCQFMKQHIE